MRRAKITHTPYFPDIGELIWLRWDDGVDLVAHSNGVKPVMVLSSHRVREQIGTVTVVPVLGNRSYCGGAIPLPYSMYTRGYIKPSMPAVLDCLGGQVSFIEMCPEYFVEKVKEILGMPCD